MNIEVNVQKANSFSIPRISQLTLKTNQFNLTTRRYQEEEVSTHTNNSQKMGVGLDESGGYLETSSGVIRFFQCGFAIAECKDVEMDMK